MPAIIEALRPRQWSKNLILFAPLLFAQRLGDVEATLRAGIAFLLFCLLSGAVYLMNDLRDLEQDRLHPTKKNRPIASGRISTTQARIALVVTLTIGLGGSYLLSSAPPSTAHVGALDSMSAPPAATEAPFVVMALIYVVIHVAYTFHLKQIVILDVMMIAMGFVVRAVAGAAAIAVAFSHWLLVCTIFLSLFLALAKRRHELTLLAEDASTHRKTLAEYAPDFLDQMIGIVASACLISYALYTMAPETIQKFGTDRLNLTIPFVIYGLFRYLYLVHRKAGGGDPANSLLSDRPLLLSVFFWAVAVIGVLYI